MGCDRNEMDGKIPEILSFADIGSFIHQPARTYSTGMLMRLAFAAAINVDPDILIIDEALAVGDVRFQQKCFRKIREFGLRNKTIVFVSHDMGAIVNLCGRVIWLKDNRIFRSGEPNRISREYIACMAYDSQTSDARAGGRSGYADDDRLSSGVRWEDASGCSSFGEGGAQIKSAAFYLRDSGLSADMIHGGEQAVFALKIEVKTDIQFPIIGFVVKDEFGNSMLGVNTAVYGKPARPLLNGESLIVEFGFKFPLLKNGHYMFSPAIAEGTRENHIQHHWVHDVCITRVANEDIRHTMGCCVVVERVDVVLEAAELAEAEC